MADVPARRERDPRRGPGVRVAPGRGYRPDPPAAAPRSGDEARAPEAGQIPAQPQTLSPVETYAAIVERPLFIPGRRPIAASARAPAPAPAPAPGGPPTLKGLIMTGDRAAAAFQLPDSKQYVLGARGEMVVSWRVEDIAPDRVVLGSNATRRVLELGDLAAPRHRAAAPGGGGRSEAPAGSRPGDSAADAGNRGAGAGDASPPKD